MQRYRWVPTIIFIPFIYFIGWLIIQPLRTALPYSYSQNLSLIGTFFSFFLFMILLSSWVRLRWKENKLYVALGLSDYSKKESFRFFLRGLSTSLGLLSCLLFPLLLSPWAKWTADLNFNIVFNSFFLILAVGLVEEILFRGWLLVEMNLLIGSRWGLVIHAAIFSLVHMRLNLEFGALIGLFVGLFLLALVLALMRKCDNGSLWGCVGLHGGLVGGWFVISSGLVEFSSETPGWLFGPGGTALNPLGGLLAIFLLILMLLYQRTELPMVRRPSKGARKASSRGAHP